ncbi:MAG: TlpA family protein disulfide reductase [Halothiobacillaceae bacterium]
MNSGITALTGQFGFGVHVVRGALMSIFACAADRWAKHGQVHRALPGLLLILVMLAGPAQVLADEDLLETVTPRESVSGFVLKDQKGKAHPLEAHRGQVVLVNFWATWCPPCRAEMPSMEALRKILADEEFAILAVNVGEAPEAVAAFLEELPGEPRFTVLLDRQSELLDLWPVRGLPTTFVLDRQGRIALQAVGGRHFDHPAIVDQIRALLDE